ncbi:hypothetical protein F4803DRAFT_544457 [Xylaria telfairii]|nr:hypothetical protein F4803DRAFT_544457 [Xylaria telfairii]
MSSASRIFAQRASMLWALTRRQATSARLAPIPRRGYARAHGAVQKSSDMPWLISSVGFTVVGLAFLMSSSPKTSRAGHGPKAADAAIEARHEKEGDSDKASSGPEKQKQEEEEEEEKKPEDDAPKGATDPSAADKASQSGQDALPPSGDNAAESETKPDEKKEGQDESKETVWRPVPEAATSSSTTSSKKTQAEDPKEDPQKGEGEADQKGSSKD